MPAVCRGGEAPDLDLSGGPSGCVALQGEPDVCFVGVLPIGMVTRGGGLLALALPPG
jgi:hypothetical protein